MAMVTRVYEFHEYNINIHNNKGCVTHRGLAIYI
jgi:hypothetical protein